MSIAGLPAWCVRTCSLVAYTCQGQSQLSSAASHHYTIDPPAVIVTPSFCEHISMQLCNNLEVIGMHAYCH